MSRADAIPTIHVTLSGDVYLKSRRTQQRLIQKVRTNLTAALTQAGYPGSLQRIGTHRYSLAPLSDGVDMAKAAALTVFGVNSVDVVLEQEFSSLDDLAGVVARHNEDRVVGRSFAARVKRRGTHNWKSVDLARLIGSLLVDAGGTVDLTDPEETVAVTVLDDKAFIVLEHNKGPGGLPIGTQDRVLCLISGGFDSVVAAWMLMSRGCSVDFVHFTLDCAQSDHALAVASELSDAWGHGMDPTVHLVEFQPLKDALFENVEARMRQVSLKVMMARAASQIAAANNIPALVTGDALGQVSSQTLPHLVAVSGAASVPVLRPLLGLPKESIIDLARKIGTAELSARAKEVCDLSEGRPVATAASVTSVERTTALIPEHILADAVATSKIFKLADWTPGQL